MARVKVVLHFTDGKVVKGFTQNFSPSRKSFHLHPLHSDNGPIEVSLNHLKAVFFVRDFTGDSQYNELREYVKGIPPSGRKVGLKFMDGERMVGSTLCYEPDRTGFFIFPADPNSNNVKAFVINSSLIKIEYL